MTATYTQSNAQVALSRLWPRLRARFARHKNRQRLNAFKAALEQDFPRLFERLYGLYGQHWDFYFHIEQVLQTAAQQWMNAASESRPYNAAQHEWIQSEQTIGATGYVDLFAGDLKGLAKRADYLDELGVSYLHLMPFFDVPNGDSDGGYAIKDYGAVNPKLGNMDDLKSTAHILKKRGVKLVLDFVFNHTSDEHAWAINAKKGDPYYKNFYWFFDSVEERDEYGKNLRDIFPDKRVGCFTWNDDVNAWVWTTFNSFQWDLNYSNPEVFNAMCGEMLKLVDAGADVIRLDALAFTWKQKGSVCENLQGAHELIQAFNAFLRISAPAVVLKSEAIVAPDDVFQYVSADECPLSYNPNLMALMWEALATRQTKLLVQGSLHRSQVPEGAAWVNYLRCHDDIGWAFADDDAWQVGINPQDHRYFLNQFFTGQFEGSFAQGVPFQFNPSNGDCRISGTLASLAGLDRSEAADSESHALKRILLMHAVMLGFKGIPLIYLGDELAMLNDHSYLNHPAHHDDSRWVHRVKFEEVIAERRTYPGSHEALVFSTLKRLILIRKAHSVFGSGDVHVQPHFDEHLFAFHRVGNDESLLVLSNFSEHERTLSPETLRTLGLTNSATDLVSDMTIDLTQPLTVKAYDFYWFLLTQR
jgi:glycosidase